MNLSNKTVNTIVNHPFFRGSAIAFLGAFAVNILSYLFNVVIGRMLGVVGYGEYLALISILYLSSVPSNVLATIVTKYVALYSAKNESEKIKPLLIIMTKYSLIFSALFLAILMIFRGQILSNLKLNDVASLILISLIFATTFPQTLLNGAFTGLQKFASANIFAAILVITRIILSILLILAGLHVNGVLIGMILSSVLVIVLSWISIDKAVMQAELTISRFIAKSRMFITYLFNPYVDKTNSITLNREMLTFTLFSTFNSWGLGSLVQTDIILAKSFLSPYEAGLYSSLAITCKVIPFFVQPLIIVMFPQIVQRVAQKKNFLPLFSVVLAVVTAGAGFVTIIYILFPTVVISLLFGSKFLAAAPYVGLFSISQLAYALVNLFSYFFLSIGRNKTAGLVMVAAILQGIGIMLFHESIWQIVTVSIIVLGGCVVLYGILTLQFYFSMRKKEL
ncbi:MAG: oligosaccharide flippase family protein [bacterium]|nr:oligosaccharide flippase family protein [bacterium]